MPTGKVLVHLIGGPFDRQTMPLANFFVRDSLAIADEVYLAQANDGGVAIRKGDAKSDRRWVSYTEHVYAKEPRARDETLYYKFERTVIVNRCEHYLPDKSRLCKNDALEGLKVCRQHSAT